MFARFGLLTSLFVIASLPANAQDEPQQKMLDMVFDAYQRAMPNATQKQMFRVFSAEHQNMISQVNTCLKNLEGYTDLETRHAPEYLLVVKFTSDEKTKLKSCTTDDLFLPVLARRSQQELEKISSDIFGPKAPEGVNFQGGISSRHNRVNMTFAKKDEIKMRAHIDALKIPDGAVRLFVSSVDPTGPWTVIPETKNVKIGETVRDGVLKHVDFQARFSKGELLGFKVIEKSSKYSLEYFGLMSGDIIIGLGKDKPVLKNTSKDVILPETEFKETLFSYLKYGSVIAKILRKNKEHYVELELDTLILLP